MRLLAFDCCADSLAAGVAEGDAGGFDMLAEDISCSNKGHAERLVPMIEAVMRVAGVGFEDIDGMVVTNGPGSFTGIRTCVAAARGIGLAARLPVLAMSTLEAVAAGHDGDDALRVVMDGRRGRRFVQDFSRPLQAETAPRSLEADEFEALPPRSITISPVDGSGREIRPHAMIRLALHRSATGDTSIDAVGLQPLYLNPPDARISAGQSLLGKKA
ncbi:MAG: tRNA (adenosine(37)-N6)-threonylcarbamoyltransferase complex dimerization subunit type 1 TsaB [Geminicoccaceae bacterium]